MTLSQVVTAIFCDVSLLKLIVLLLEEIDKSKRQNSKSINRSNYIGKFSIRNRLLDYWIKGTLQKWCWSNYKAIWKR